MMYRSFRLLLCFVVGIISFSSNSKAQKHHNSQIDATIRKGIDELLRQDYQTAKNTFRKLESDFRFNPLGKIFIVASDIFINQDTGEPIDFRTANQVLTDAEGLAERLLDSEPENVWNQYNLALIESYRAVLKGISGNWVSALSTGYSAKRAFQRCLDLQPGFMEANVAIGNWMYWSSEKIEFLTWLPFISDERENGIVLLQQAMRSHCYHYYSAAHTLARIFINKKQSQTAVNLLAPFLKKYPESRFFQWDVARAYEDINKNRAIIEYLKLLDMYKAIELPNKSRLYLIYYILAKMYYFSGDYKTAKMYIFMIPPFEKMIAFEREELDERKTKIENLKQILQSLK